MALTVSTYSDQWYQLRKTHLGASEIAALCGVDPWKTPEQVWDSKHSNDGVLQPQHRVNTRVWWGHAEEKAIIEAATYEWGLSDLICHTGTSWYQQGLMVSPDAVLLESPTHVEHMTDVTPILVEAKTVGASMASKWAEGPPIYVLLQAYTQLALMRAEIVLIAARIAGAPVQVWSIDREDERIPEMIMTVVRRFWEAERMPDDWYGWVKNQLVSVGLLAPVKEFKKRKLETLEEMIAVNELVRAKADLAKAKQKVDDAKAHIAFLLGDGYDALVDDTGRVFLSEETYHRKTLDVASLLEDHPEMDKYYTKVPYTTYRIIQEGR